MQRNLFLASASLPMRWSCSSVLGKILLSKYLTNPVLQAEPKPRPMVSLWPMKALWCRPLSCFSWDSHTMAPSPSNFSFKMTNFTQTPTHIQLQLPSDISDSANDGWIRSKRACFFLSFLLRQEHLMDLPICSCEGDHVNQFRCRDLYM